MSAVTDKREEDLKALNCPCPQPIKGLYVTVNGLDIPVKPVRGTVTWDGEKWTFEREKSEPSEQGGECCDHD